MNESDSPINILKQFAPKNSDVVWHPLWDYQRFSVARANASDSRADFFQVPMGQSFFGSDADRAFTPGRCRMQSETVMYLAGMLPKGNSFYLTAIRCPIIPGYWSDIDNDSDDWDEYQLGTRGIITLTVLNRRYFESTPLATCPALYPMPRKARLKNLSKIARKNELRAQTHSYQQLTPIYIEQQPFNVSIRFDTPIPLKRDAMIGVILDGYIIREPS